MAHGQSIMPSSHFSWGIVALYLISVIPHSLLLGNQKQSHHTVYFKAATYHT